MTIHTVHLLWTLLALSTSFQPIAPIRGRLPSSLMLGPFDFFGGTSNAASGGPSSVPKSPSDRDNQAIQAIKQAIENPKTSNLPLIECEFPPLQELNKLGDGSLRSANLVDDANLAFCSKLIRGLAPLPMMGPKVWLLTSGTSSSGFMSKAIKTAGVVGVVSVKDGIPDEVAPGSICVFVSPTSRSDYQLAKQLASSGRTDAVVVVNGLTKDQKSMSSDATMAYFLKPLTYNSQIVGYLARSYPNDWTTIDLVSKQVLSTYKDSEILFGKTNTPDLRDPGRRVQKAVDERAIAARRNG